MNLIVHKASGNKQPLIFVLPLYFRFCTQYLHRSYFCFCCLVLWVTAR